jgi:hypothetical protein
MTSDERREVAKRLRENASKHCVTLDYLGSTQVASWWLLLHTIGCESNEQESAFRMLADLIDPTCELDAIAGSIDAEMVELPRDRDGVPIHVGDTVYDGDECGHTVLGIVLKAAGGLVITPLYEEDKSGELTNWLTPSELTHNRPDSNRPDSLERIADELDGMVDDAGSADDRCEQLADLADRIRKLAATKECE